MRARAAGGGGRDRGQSTVELALLLPVVVLLLLTVLQVGLVARDVVLVTHAAREAARAAAVDPAPGAARSAALRSSGLRPDDLTVRVIGRTGPSGRVTVILKYHPTSAVPLVGEWVAARAITVTAAMRVEPPSPTTKGANFANRTKPLLTNEFSVEIHSAGAGSRRIGSEHTPCRRGGQPAYSPRWVVPVTLVSSDTSH